ncbi:MAG: pilus assembly protein PilE [Methylotenera sp.]|nr:MAG: pilus assembly protein PilE [Methylotenera sp.]
MNNIKHLQKGVTLVELMIVVAIVGILASIIVPSYADYVQRGKVAEATSTLADLKSRMEQCFQDHKDYTHATCAALCATPAGSKYFSYSCDPASTTDTYTLAATAVAGLGVDNFSFTINQDSAKTSNFGGNSGNCWLTKKTGGC